MNTASRVGAAFVVLFVAAFVLALGTLVGMFADPDRVFVEHFADEANQLRGIAGSFLLALSGLVFAMFADALSRDADEHRNPLLITGFAAAGAALVAFTAVLFLPLFLFIAWVAAVTFTHRAAAQQ